MSDKEWKVTRKYKTNWFQWNLLLRSDRPSGKWRWFSLKFKNIILNVKRCKSIFLVNKSQWFLIAKEAYSHFDQIRLWVWHNRISNMMEYLLNFMPRKESNESCFFIYKYLMRFENGKSGIMWPSQWGWKDYFNTFSRNLTNFSFKILEKILSFISDSVAIAR